MADSPGNARRCSTALPPYANASQRRAPSRPGAHWGLGSAPRRPPRTLTPLLALARGGWTYAAAFHGPAHRHARQLRPAVQAPTWPGPRAPHFPRPPGSGPGAGGSGGPDPTLDTMGTGRPGSAGRCAAPASRAPTSGPTDPGCRPKGRGSCREARSTKSGPTPGPGTWGDPLPWHTGGALLPTCRELRAAGLRPVCALRPPPQARRTTPAGPGGAGTARPPH